MTEPTHDQVADFDDALARAFAKVDRARPDGVDKNIKKDGKDRRYVTLASTDEACREALTGEGFSFPQLATTEPTDGGGLWLTITTQLRRKGVKIETTLGLPVLGQMRKGGEGFAPPTAQSVGSAMTYGRRYALSALLGVCPDEDDDGHAASRRDEPDTDPAWERLQGATADLARLLRCSTDDAAGRVKHQAGDRLGTIGSNGPTDAQVATLTTAAQELLEFVRNPPREPQLSDQERAAIKSAATEPAKSKPSAAKSKATPSAKASTEPAEPRDVQAARKATDSAYRAYQDTCKEEGVAERPWMDIAYHAIGKAWDIKQGSHGVEDYERLAAAYEDEIDRVRKGEGAVT